MKVGYTEFGKPARGGARAVTTWPARAHRARSPRRSKGAVTETQPPLLRYDPDIERTCTHIPSSSRDCAERRRSCWRSRRCRCGRGRQCRDHCDAYVFRAGATRGERNGPAAEQAQMAQRTRHGRPSDKGQMGCPAIGLLWARYRRAKCLLSGEDFPPSPPSFRPGFSRSCAAFSDLSSPTFFSGAGVPEGVG